MKPLSCTAFWRIYLCLELLRIVNPKIYHWGTSLVLLPVRNWTVTSQETFQSLCKTVGSALGDKLKFPSSALGVPGKMKNTGNTWSASNGKLNEICVKGANRKGWVVLVLDTSFYYVQKDPSIRGKKRKVVAVNKGRWDNWWHLNTGGIGIHSQINELLAGSGYKF